MRRRIGTTPGRLAGLALAAAISGLVWCVAAGVVAPETAALVATVLVAGGLGAWLALVLRVLPRRDREAAEHLDLLVDRTCQPGTRLVAVVATSWANQAGQVAAVVDVKTDRAGDQWFSLACFPPGSLVLIRRDAPGPDPLDWMSPGEVEAAHRHRARAARPRRWSRGRGSLSRRDSRRLMTQIEAALRAGPLPDASTRPPEQAKRPKSNRQNRGHS